MRVDKGYEAQYVYSLQDERNPIALIIIFKITTNEVCVLPQFEANRFGKCSRDTWWGEGGKGPILIYV